MLGNLFIAPASLFQNGYLEDERGYSAALIAAFTLATATPAGIGLIVGGRLADVRGRRRVIAVCVPVAAALLVVSYSIGGPPMWLAATLGGIIGAIAFPAVAVYRNELFPTGSRSRASALVTAAALLGGIVGLVVMGALLDGGRTHGVVLGWLATGQLVVVAIVLLWFPETAHRELEDLNPIDRRCPAHVGVSSRADRRAATLGEQLRRLRRGIVAAVLEQRAAATRLRTAASSRTSRTALRRRDDDGVFLNAAPTPKCLIRAPISAFSSVSPTCTTGTPWWRARLVPM